MGFLFYDSFLMLAKWSARHNFINFTVISKIISYSGKIEIMLTSKLPISNPNPTSYTSDRLAIL